MASSHLHLELHLHEGFPGPGQLDLRLHQPPLLLHDPGLSRHRLPRGLGLGGVNLEHPPLHHHAVQPPPGGQSLLAAAQGDEAEALGALLVEDDLGLGDAAEGREQAGELGEAEAEGKVGDVEAMDEVPRGALEVGEGGAGRRQGGAGGEEGGVPVGGAVAGLPPPGVRGAEGAGGGGGGGGAAPGNNSTSSEIEFPPGDGSAGGRFLN